MFVFGASSAAATATTSTHLLCGTLHSPYSPSTAHNFSSHLFPTTSVWSSSLHFRCVPIRAMAEIDTIAVSKTASSSSSPGSKQALISLSNKKDLAFVGNGLQELGYTIVSTGGTASALESAGVAVTKVEQLTKFAEMQHLRHKPLVSEPTLPQQRRWLLQRRTTHGHHFATPPTADSQLVTRKPLLTAAATTAAPSSTSPENQWRIHMIAFFEKTLYPWM